MLKRLTNLKVGTRIFAGFGVVLALLLAVGLTAIYSLNDATSAFDTQDGLAGNAVRVGQIDRDFVGLRRSVYVYMDAGKDADLARANEIRKALPEAIAKAVSGLRVPERRQAMEQVGKQVGEYSAGFDALLQLRAKREDAVNKQMNPLGLKARTNLSEIVKSAIADKDYEAAAFAGDVVEHLMQARLNAVRFLANPSDDVAKRALSELEGFTKSVPELVGRLQNPQRKALANEVATIVTIATMQPNAAELREVEQRLKQCLPS